MITIVEPTLIEPNRSQWPVVVRMLVANARWMVMTDWRSIFDFKAWSCISGFAIHRIFFFLSTIDDIERLMTFLGILCDMGSIVKSLTDIFIQEGSNFGCDEMQIIGISFSNIQGPVF